MVEFVRRIFSGDYMPHGMCYLWDPSILWLHVISDALIGLAYYAIPFVLFSVFRRRRDLEFRGMFFAFALFIFACGTTHLLAVWTVWHGTYRIEGLVKAITAGASIVTAVLLVPLVPQLVTLPSPRQLRQANTALAEEIEERKRAEEEVRKVNAELETRVAERTAELEAALERYQFLADAMPQIVWTARGDGVRDYFNQRFYDYSGLPPESRDWQSLIHQDDLPAVITKWQYATSTGQNHEAEARLRSASGEYRWHLSRAVPMRGEDNVVTQWVGTATDVHDAKQIQQELLQAQKMEAVGRLAGGVAHDFNNLLTVISGFTEMVVQGLPQESDLHDYANEIAKAATRAGEITDQLLSFSRKRLAERAQMVNINELVARTEKMLRRLIGEDIDLAISLEPALGSIEADPGQIEQILLNLAVNARDAMPSGGKLTIETTNVRLDQRFSERHFDVQPGEYVQVAVSDTGIGMDTDVRNHLFEPFFTTKPKGEGTGLGLSIVYGIIKQSGGGILVYSEPGRGASFKIYLPRKYGAGVQQETAALPPPLAGSETVLVVEDDPGLLKLVSSVLVQHGYTVLAARTPNEAIALATQNNNAIDMLLTDVVMPQMSGPELAQTLSEVRRGLKVIYMSGYAEAGISRHGILHAGADFIQKPFNSTALAAKVRSVFDSFGKTSTP